MSLPVAQVSLSAPGASNALDGDTMEGARHSSMGGPVARAGATAEQLMLVLVALYVSAGAMVYAGLGDPSFLARLLVPGLWASLGYVAPLGALVVLTYHRLAARGPDGARITDSRAGWRAGWAAARRGAFSPSRLRFAIVTMLAAPLFLNAFSAWKVLIPVLHPFSRDAVLSAVDMLLHGGAPHRLLAWVPLQPLDMIYFFGWGQVLVVTLLMLAWRGESRILLAFVLTWIVLGTVMACVVSSAGPPYFLALTGRDTYAGLISHLSTANGGGPLLAVKVQRSLWEVYTSRTIMAGGGISAFPSMHVAVPALLTFAIWRRSHTLSMLLGGFTLVILVSSVALGWHYAVDGYASILGSGIIWLLVARLPIRQAFKPA